MKIAIIEDQEEIRYSIGKILEEHGDELVEFDGSPMEYSVVLKKEKIELLILDVMLDGENGIDILKSLRREGMKLPIILITAYTTPTNIIEASRFGVKDILQKPFDADELLSAIAPHRGEKTQGKSSIELQAFDYGFVGSYATMGEIYKQIGVMAGNDLSVMINGETGTGKELVASMLHQFSIRKMAPFITLNCAAIPKDLFESQLFGHERGAFTGADRHHVGYIEQADNGVLFLDEIGEMDILLQSKLLRFLETKKIRRLGGNRDIDVDVKIVSATNIAIDSKISDGLFREDLYYRLSQLSITLPPLRERKNDIPILCSYFIQKANQDLSTSVIGISEEAIQSLKEHPWPGNVREFKNTIFKAVLHSRSGVIDRIHLKPCNNQQQNSDLIVPFLEDLLTCAGDDNGALVLERIEKELISLLLHRHKHNITHVASSLQISRNTLKSKMGKHSLRV